MTAIRVANFVSPLNQFVEGYQDECVAYGICDIYYSVPVNDRLQHTASDVTRLADIWYTKETGNPASTSGLSLAQAHNVLSGLALTYKDLPLDINAVKECIKNEQIPVLVTAPEASFYDTGLKRVPYKWDYSQYNHSIVAYGISDAGNLLVRDYANVLAEPGSEREYDAAKISLISAIAITPPWKRLQQQPFTYSEEELEEWTRLDRNMPQGTGLMLAWAKARRTGHIFGSPEDREYQGTFQGQKATMQNFSYALAVDINAVHTFWDARGAIGTF